MADTISEIGLFFESATLWPVHPFPCGADNIEHVASFGLPAEGFLDMGGIGNEFRRVSFTARAIADRDRFTCDFLGGSDDFLYGYAFAGSEVAADGFVFGENVVERQTVG